MQQVTTPQQFITFLRGLRAVRQFRQEALPPDAINGLQEVVRWSGSASNRQHWEVVMVQNKEMLQKLAACEGHAKHLETAALGVVLVMAGNANLVEQETYDEGRLSERIMLAAKAYGLGSCIGWFRGHGADEVKSLLAIPSECLVRTVISIGYPDVEALRARPKVAQPRKPTNEIIHFERYS